MTNAFAWKIVRNCSGAAVLVILSQHTQTWRRQRTSELLVLGHCISLLGLSGTAPYCCSGFGHDGLASLDPRGSLVELRRDIEVRPKLSSGREFEGTVFEAREGVAIASLGLLTKVSILYIGHLGPLICFPPFLLTKVAKVAKLLCGPLSLLTPPAMLLDAALPRLDA